MGDSSPEGADRLTCQRALAAWLRERHRRHDRHSRATLLEMLHHGEQRGLEVQGVKGRLREQQIDASVQQTADLLVVRRAQLLERHVACPRVRDVSGKRTGLRRRPQRASDEARPRRLATHYLLDRHAGDCGSGAIHLVGKASQAVFSLGDAIRVEGVCLEDVCTGL